MKLPFDKLQTLDDAFDVRVDEISRQNLASGCQRAAKKFGRSFSYRTIADEGVYEVSLARPFVASATLRPRRPG